MSVVYVQRAGGVVVGVYSVLQPGIAEEALASDHADVLAYLLGPADADLLAAARLAAKQLLMLSRADLPTALRALALTAMDGDNILRQWITDFKAQVALATTLQNLQARVAALSNLPQLTAANVKSAVANRVDTPEADS